MLNRFLVCLLRLLVCITSVYEQLFWWMYYIIFWVGWVWFDDYLSLLIYIGKYSYELYLCCLKRINTYFLWFLLILHYNSLWSGEKTAAKDWPGFLEIKGRVRLDAFEKFLQDLRFTRSRAIMVSQVFFCCARALFIVC